MLEGVLDNTALNEQHFIVFVCAIGTLQRKGLDLSSIARHYHISNGRVFSFP